MTADLRFDNADEAVKYLATDYVRSLAAEQDRLREAAQGMVDAMFREFGDDLKDPMHADQTDHLDRAYHRLKAALDAGQQEGGSENDGR